MRPGLLTNFLTGLFVIGAITAAALSLWYVASLRILKRTQAELAAVNHNTMVVRSLVTDALEYRKRNPAIDPILQAAKLVVPPAGLGTNMNPPRINR